MFLFAFNLKVMADVSKPLFRAMNEDFKSLVNVTLWSPGFHSSVSPNLFTGLENLQNFKVLDTKISSISQEAFHNLRNLQGILHYILSF